MELQKKIEQALLIGPLSGAIDRVQKVVKEHIRRELWAQMDVSNSTVGALSLWKRLYPGEDL